MPKFNAASLYLSDLDSCWMPNSYVAYQHILYELKHSDCLCQERIEQIIMIHNAESQIKQIKAALRAWKTANGYV